MFIPMPRMALLLSVAAFASAALALDVVYVAQAWDPFGSSALAKESPVSRHAIDTTTGAGLLAGKVAMSRAVGGGKVVAVTVDSGARARYEVTVVDHSHSYEVEVSRGFSVIGVR